MPTLSILTFTQLKDWSIPFLRDLARVAGLCHAELVMVVDTREMTPSVTPLFTQPDGRVLPDQILWLRSKGYVESILEEGVAQCNGEFILRMDDDERIPPAMVDWLVREEYRGHPHWKFATANMWGDEKHFIFNAPLWPDHHTRLSLKTMSGGRNCPHAGSPFGGGEFAPVIFEHHKFLAKTWAERTAIAARYDCVGDGYGTGSGIKCFSLPEECYDVLYLAETDEGTWAGCANSKLTTANVGVTR